MPATYTEIKFYNISDEKKKVSKSLGNAVITLDGVFLAGTTLSNPSFRISVTKAQLTGVNYAYIADFKRYYYVTEAKFDGNSVWTVSLKVDVLKSFATNIHLSSAYVVRTSNSTYINDQIPDNKYPIEIEPNIISYTGSAVTQNNNWRSSDNAFAAGTTGEYAEYHYIIVVRAAYIEMDDDLEYVSTTGTAYICCNTQGLFKFWQSMSHSKLDISKYVVDVFWLPFEIPKDTTKYIKKIWCNEVIGSDIGSGYYFIGTGMDINDPSNNKLYLISKTQFEYDFEVDVSNLVSYEYQKYRPFAEISACFLPFGTFPLDMGFIENGGNNYVRFLVKCNILSGAASLYYHNGASTALSDLRYLASATLKVSSIISGSGGTGQFVSSAVSAIGSAAAGAAAGASAGGVPGGIIGGAIGAISSFAMSGLNFDNHKLMVSGSPNSRVELVPMVYLTSYRQTEGADERAIFGKPCARTLLLSTGTGGNFTSGDYVQCDEVHLNDSGMLSSEIDEVEVWLKTGVYI